LAILQEGILQWNEDYRINRGETEQDSIESSSLHAEKSLELVRHDSEVASLTEDKHAVADGVHWGRLPENYNSNAEQYIKADERSINDLEPDMVKGSRPEEAQSVEDRASRP